MRKLNMEKLADLPTANDMLDEKYGVEGTESRAKFDEESKAWYDSQISGTYRITMPKALHESLSSYVKERGTNISAFVSEVIARELDATC